MEGVHWRLGWWRRPVWGTVEGSTGADGEVMPSSLDYAPIHETGFMIFMTGIELFWAQSSSKRELAAWNVSTKN